MSYVIIDNFSAGVDRSRPIYALPAGTLWECINAHITRGGDIEKRKAFVAKYQLPIGTMGLATTEDNIYVFGSIASPAGIPAGVTYQRLQHPDGATAMTKFIHYDLYNGKVYALAQFADGKTYNFYDGALVTAWINGIVAPYMVDNTGIAEHLRALVDAHPDLTATRTGSVITIEKTTNGTFTITASATNGGTVNDQTLTLAQVTVGGVSAKEKWTATVGGTFDVGDKFDIFINNLTHYGAVGNPTGDATFVKTHKRKVYTIAASILQSSAVDDATKWNSINDAGASFANVSNNNAGSAKLTSLCVYQDKLAIFSRRVIQIWYVADDATANLPIQIITQSGTRSPRSVAALGDLDVFYLSSSGIRSLQARQIINIAGVQDVGTPVDQLVRQWIKTQLDADVVDAAAIVEPLDSRYMLAIGTRIFVFSYFPSKRISAWTWYDVGFKVEYWAEKTDRIYARSGNTIYLYGGDDNETYDDCKVTVTIPYLDLKKPENYKNLNGIDMASSGSWNVNLLTNPNDINQMVKVGLMENVTYGSDDTSALGHFTHVGATITNQQFGYASISNVALTLQGGESA